MQYDKEFLVSVIVIGGVLFAGLLICLGLTLVAIGVYNRVTKKKITKELYEKKERENGQHRGGARGKF